LVSDATLYILDNLAALDVAFLARYAKEKGIASYVPVSERDVEYETVQRAINNLRLELLPMTCDIESGLNAIAAAIAGLDINLSCGGGAGYGAGMSSCISPLDNEELLGPGDSEQGDPLEGPPPAGFATWPEYFSYKCQAAYFIWHLMEKYILLCASFDLVAISAAVVGPSVAGLAGALPAAFTPAGFVIFVSSVVAIALLAGWAWFYMDEMHIWWVDNKQEIVCMLYNSGSSAEAISGLSNAIEDGIQAIITWGTLEAVAGAIAELLGVAFGQLAGNGIVEPLFKAVAAVAAVGEQDCSECGQQGLIFATSMQSPYNVLLEGDEITFDDEAADWGYRAHNGGDSVYLYFRPTGVIDAEAWQWEAECSDIEHPTGLRTYVWELQYEDDGWHLLQQWISQSNAAGDWNPFEYVVNAAISPAYQYRFRFNVQDANLYGWIRKLRAYPIETG
jgi:hypothetical protein